MNIETTAQSANQQPEDNGTDLVAGLRELGDAQTFVADLNLLRGVTTLLDPSEAYSGEQALWAACLLRALDDADGKDGAGKLACDCDGVVRVGNHRNLPPSHTYQECSHQWLASDNHEEGAFLWVCDLLKLEPGYVRRVAGR